MAEPYRETFTTQSVETVLSIFTRLATTETHCQEMAVIQIVSKKKAGTAPMPVSLVSEDAEPETTGT